MKEFFTNADLLIVRATGKSGKTYTALVADLGYTRKYLTFDSYVIAEIVGESNKTICELPVGEYPVTHE